jgi:hypothetical protein
MIMKKKNFVMKNQRDKKKSTRKHNRTMLARDFLFVHFMRAKKMQRKKNLFPFSKQQEQKKIISPKKENVFGKHANTSFKHVIILKIKILLNSYFYRFFFCRKYCVDTTYGILLKMSVCIADGIK